MACEICSSEEAKINPKHWHVVRVCEQCGADFRTFEPGEHGIGMKIRKGDRVTIPAEAISFSANPLKGSGHLTRHGVEWFAELAFKVDIATKDKRDNFSATLNELQEANEEYFIGLPALNDLDLNNEEDAEEAFRRLNEIPKTSEWWSYMAAAFCNMAAEAIGAGDANTAAWATACAERFRNLVVFRENFSEVVFMGNSAGRLIQLMRTWDVNRTNADEGFWHETLKSNSWTFSQLFSAPVEYVGDKAFVGGTDINRKGGRYLDFMLSSGATKRALLVEIKTPVARLMGSKYRNNVFAPSRELAGSVAQIQDYCDSFRKSDVGREFNTFSPKMVILIGDYQSELVSDELKSSFDRYRSSLQNLEIVTYDEFFIKLEQLAKLFNLIRTPQ